MEPAEVRSKFFRRKEIKVDACIRSGDGPRLNGVGPFIVALVNGILVILCPAKIAAGGNHIRVVDKSLQPVPPVLRQGELESPNVLVRVVGGDLVVRHAIVAGVSHELGLVADVLVVRRRPEKEHVEQIVFVPQLIRHGSLQREIGVCEAYDIAGSCLMPDEVEVLRRGNLAEVSVIEIQFCVFGDWEGDVQTGHPCGNALRRLLLQEGIDAEGGRAAEQFRVGIVHIPLAAGVRHGETQTGVDDHPLKFQLVLDIGFEARRIRAPF